MSQFAPETNAAAANGSRPAESGHSTATATARYPKGVICDFRKMGKASLIRILAYYNIRVDHSSLHDLPSENDLAVMVAKLFEARKIAEADVVDHFAAKYCLSTMDMNNRNPIAHAQQHALAVQAAASASAKNGTSGGNGSAAAKPAASAVNFERMQLDSEPAKVGEQVAAKISSDDWILGCILSYDAQAQTYEVQDEDDPSRIVTLPAFTHVKRLYDSAAYLHKGDAVLAVFPDTTSFYRAVVVRNPRPPGAPADRSSGGSSAGGSSSSSGWDVVVRFDDDEDDSGRSPPRRIPARFILLVSDVLLPNSPNSVKSPSSYVRKPPVSPSAAGADKKAATNGASTAEVAQQQSPDKLIDC